MSHKTQNIGSKARTGHISLSIQMGIQKPNFFLYGFVALKFIFGSKQQISQYGFLAYRHFSTYFYIFSGSPKKTREGMNTWSYPWSLQVNRLNQNSKGLVEARSCRQAILCHLRK